MTRTARHNPAVVQNVKNQPPRYEIRRFRFDNGEVLYHLADRVTGLPDLYAFRYIWVEVRPTGASSGTIRNKMIAIGVGMTFVRDLGIDIEQRIAAGRYLEDEELLGLAVRCIGRADGQGRIGGITAADRYATFVDYFRFRTGEVRQYAPERDHAMIAEAEASFLKRAGKHTPNRSEGAATVERLGLPPEVRSRFLQIIRPDSPENPFQPRLRVRNHAMLLLAYTFGFRSGELMAFKRSDFDNRASPPTITVHRRPDDVAETRREPALAKTLGRTLPIEGDALTALVAWLTDRGDRAKWPEARRHPFIFVARTGAPLSLRRARQMYEQLRKAHPEFGPLVQHTLRHDANDRWTEHDEATGANLDISRRQRTYANGWSETSKMPDKYGKAAIRRGAAKRIETLQKESMTHKK